MHAQACISYSNLSNLIIAVIYLSAAWNFPYPLRDLCLYGRGNLSSWLQIIIMACTCRPTSLLFNLPPSEIVDPSKRNISLQPYYNKSSWFDAYILQLHAQSMAVFWELNMIMMGMNKKFGTVENGC